MFTELSRTGKYVENNENLISLVAFFFCLPKRGDNLVETTFQLL
jgi:hypothetical protein